MKQLLGLIAIFMCFSLSAQDSWIQVDSMNGPPKSVTTSFVLQDTGYVIGGFLDNEFTRKMYSYNPIQDDWDDEVSLSGETGSGNSRGSAVSFAIENKGYVGLGQGNTAGYYTDFWEYDAATEAWTQIADFAGTGRRGAVAFAINGFGYVGTGQDATGLKKDFYKYDPSTNSWTQLSDFIGTARKYAVGFTMGGQAYVGTGDDGVYKNDFYMYLAEFDTWVVRASIPAVGRAGSVGWGSFPTAFICTGEDPAGNVSSDLWEFNYYSNAWIQKADFTGPARKHATAFVIDGIGYVGTGFNNGTFYDDFYAYTPMLGINDWSIDDFTIYPNPATSTIQWQNAQIELLIITDFSGKVMDTNFDRKQQAVSIAHLSAGAYFIQANTMDGHVLQTSFVKQ